MLISFETPLEPRPLELLAALTRVLMDPALLGTILASRPQENMKRDVVSYGAPVPESAAPLGCDRNTGGWRVWLILWGGARTPVAMRSSRVAHSLLQLLWLSSLVPLQPVSLWPLHVLTGRSLERSSVPP